MRFFNFDLHISVIEDIKTIFHDMHHQVDSWLGSGHAWVFGQNPVNPKHVNRSNWTLLTKKKADAFYTKYKKTLNLYDAFIVTHTPVFSYLFEKTNKPIITVASTRYEYPFRGDSWKTFNEFLRERIDTHQIIPLANNKYDAHYCEYFTGRQWSHIPSLCEYTHTKYSPTHQQLLYCSQYKPQELLSDATFVDKDTLGRYQWSDLTKYKGYVHIPYNASTMSIFEHYTQNVPLFFPSKAFMIELRQTVRRGIMDQCSWFEIKKESYIMPEKHLDCPDPNAYEDIESFGYWQNFSDFYDESAMPHIVYFDSFDDLKQKAKNVDYAAISESMRIHNRNRKIEVYSKWSDVLRAI
jgi:hypothetical protein